MENTLKLGVVYIVNLIHPETFWSLNYFEYLIYKNPTNKKTMTHLR